MVNAMVAQFQPRTGAVGIKRPCHGHNVNVGPDLNLFVKIDDMGVMHAKAPMRDGATDRAGSVGAMDPVKGVAKI